MSATVHRIGPHVLTKQQLAVELKRSTRWIEIRVNQGMPTLDHKDRHGRRLFDLHAVNDWLNAGQPQATTLSDRLAVMETEMARLRARVNQLERRAS